ncbi:hypothetical protein F4827_002210 [Paraburkholderia bannensis]|uniref:HAD family hydrolase n=1 Tax=Paraburkholderia bannensis TaxID=765414 RepID=A0A7W9TVU9_9BURK|nr:hypothetical protein [Paraburkholderia sp. WP4_3_2]MBB6102361.1 hypothetical protein [Paraburkholderia bannensis]
MQPLSCAPFHEFSAVRFVLTDMDETLTYQGRLAAATYDALERLQSAGIRVIPVTAAPAGWCDQMARMWPVDGVIAENGGIFMRRDGTHHGIERTWWTAPDAVSAMRAQLSAIAKAVQAAVPEAQNTSSTMVRAAPYPPISASASVANGVPLSAPKRNGAHAATALVA